MMDSMKELIKNRIRESINVKSELLNQTETMQNLEDLAEICIKSLKSGGKVLFCGNGGSAADAQHLAAELSGRFYYDRPPLNSEALHVNTSYLTAVANDYSYDEIYARLIRGLGKKGDVLIGLSTSGNSANVVKAFMAATEKEMITAGFTGLGGGKMKAYSQFTIQVPSTDTPRIQEAHILLGHILCEYIEAKLFPKP
jgi:D-sedoheptulose 7-phosphate isomerase